MISPKSPPRIGIRRHQGRIRRKRGGKKGWAKKGAIKGSGLPSRTEDHGRKGEKPLKSLILTRKAASKVEGSSRKVWKRLTGKG